MNLLTDTSLGIMLITFASYRLKLYYLPCDLHFLTEFKSRETYARRFCPIRPAIQ